MDPEPFIHINKVIHEKGRLGIVSMLAASPNLSFSEIKEALRMTDGNLTAHMKTLQQAGYVAVTKAINKKRSLTTYSLTPDGQKEFETYLAHLDNIVRQTKIIKPREIV